MIFGEFKKVFICLKILVTVFFESFNQSEPWTEEDVSWMKKADLSTPPGSPAHDPMSDIDDDGLTGEVGEIFCQF